MRNLNYCINICYDACFIKILLLNFYDIKVRQNEKSHEKMDQKFLRFSRESSFIFSNEISHESKIFLSKKKNENETWVSKLVEIPLKYIKNPVVPKAKAVFLSENNYFCNTNVNNSRYKLRLEN
ncbi:hypothetical protein BpHYR1_024206 [Brachionus plicatilis]|uniref:Uncharacterized protein n=1 Tax=Brachionus plicatilis TaxID=10195 RepID=A0A3M7SHD3_BRAPC|nr:hypothetical protein BpHYR1_024206 [Brachionus plicatilis]